MIKNRKKEDATDGKKEIDENNSRENSKHLGSSSAFEETEDPLSRDPDNISDEKLDELLGE